jgi:hypothetical protein
MAQCALAYRDFTLMRRFLFLCFAIALSGWGMACRGVPRAKATSKPTLPLDARPAAGAGLSDEEISRAAKLSLNKCVRCHQLYDPASYSDADWTAWMGKMSRKAHLKSDQTKLLSRYFEAFRSTHANQPQ